MPSRSRVSVPLITSDRWRTVQSTPFSTCKLPYGTTRLELVTSGRSVEISELLFGQTSAAKVIDAAVVIADIKRTTAIARGQIIANRVGDIPSLLLAGGAEERASARIFPGPKVSFASWRWGTEPEGWYVDLPDADFIAGVNYSPLEYCDVKCDFQFRSILK